MLYRTGTIGNGRVYIGAEEVSIAGYPKFPRLCEAFKNIKTGMGDFYVKAGSNY